MPPESQPLICTVTDALGAALPAPLIVPSAVGGSVGPRPATYRVMTDPGAAGRSWEFAVPSWFTTARIATAVGDTGTRIALESEPPLSTCTVAAARPASPNGAMQTTCSACTETRGAGIPSNVTRVPASVVSSAPTAVTWLSAC